MNKDFSQNFPDGFNNFSSERCSFREIRDPPNDIWKSESNFSSERKIKSTCQIDKSISPKIESENPEISLLNKRLKELESKFHQMQEEYDSFKANISEKELKLKLLGNFHNPDIDRAYKEYEEELEDQEF